jgi:hypothetical protein
MSARPALPRRALKPRLATQLILVLSLAILPLGLISLYQTTNVLQERQSLSEAALLQRTQQAVDESREVIRSAISSAETLAVQISALQSSGDTCGAVMSEVVERSDNFAFAGYRDNVRGLICASKDVSANTESPLDALPEIDQQSESVLLRPLEFLGGIATFSVTVPVIDDGRFVGTVWVAVPVTALNGALSQAGETVNLVLFKANGDIIATEDFTENRRLRASDLSRREPRGRNPRFRRLVHRLGSGLCPRQLDAAGAWHPDADLGTGTGALFPLCDVGDHHRRGLCRRAPSGDPPRPAPALVDAALCQRRV